MSWNEDLRNSKGDLEPKRKEFMENLWRRIMPWKWALYLKVEYNGHFAVNCKVGWSDPLPLRCEPLGKFRTKRTPRFCRFLVIWFHPWDLKRFPLSINAINLDLDCSGFFRHCIDPSFGAVKRQPLCKRRGTHFAEVGSHPNQKKMHVAGQACS